MTQSLAINKLGSDEVTTCLVAHFINREDVRMVQRRGGISFLIKAAESIAVLREFFGEQFQCNFAPELRVFGKINFAHPAGAELFENPIAADVFQIHGG